MHPESLLQTRLMPLHYKEITIITPIIAGVTIIAATPAIQVAILTKAAIPAKDITVVVVQFITAIDAATTFLVNL